MLEGGVPFWITLIAVGVLGSITGTITLFTIWPSSKRKNGDVLRQVAATRAATRAVIDAKIEELADHESSGLDPATTPIVNRRVDPSLFLLLDLFIRDFFLAWFGKLVNDPRPVETVLRNDLNIFLRNLRIRLEKIDKVKFFTNDLMLKITSHFEKIRIAQTLYLECKDRSKPAKIVISSYLESEEREMAFLRKVCEALLVVLLPKSYSRYRLPRRILRDVISSTMLYPLINRICDPDYLNQQILSYITRHKDSLELHRTTFRYAASYEDFVKMIQECSSVEELRQLRHGIMTEIAQATTINNLKASKSGPEGAPGSLEGHAGKAELVHVRNLARYLNQLMVAKNHCEQRLLALARDMTLSMVEPVVSEEHQPSVEPALSHIDDDASSRDSSVDETPAIPNEEKDYTKAQISLLEDKLRALESARLAASCPKTTASLGKEIQDLTEDIHKLECYASRSALWMDHIGQWRACVQSADGTEEGGPVFLLLVQKEQVMLSPMTYENGGKFEFGQQSNERLLPEPDDFLGDGWVVPRKLAEFHELKEKLAAIAGELLKNKELPAVCQKSFFAKGWDKAEIDKAKAQVQTFLNVILRNERLSHCQDVFSFLCPLPEHLQPAAKPPLPPLSTQRQSFADDSVISPTTASGKGKPKFSLATLFNRPGSDKEESSPPAVGASNGSSANLAALAKVGDEVDCSELDNDAAGLARDGSMRQQQRDSIAEPLYGLVQEIFEVQGIFRWLRKTLITFVQITYGRTINRQIRETVAWLVSDSMLITYCNAVKDAYWPNGKLAQPVPARSDEQKLRTRYEAKEKFLVSIPAVLSNLVGQQNAKRGAVRIFETIQDQRLNKQLVYSILEVLLMQICPEIEET